MPDRSEAGGSGPRQRARRRTGAHQDPDGIPRIPLVTGLRELAGR
ncbi:hypothetical protein J2X68_006306 [Streptomyces sp. 3330]|nr:hypothetical protein [Streptomyces sp. 3330]MDR6979570.1 hypothetical protein [Streptomyces sp. 3330]